MEIKTVAVQGDTQWLHSLIKKCYEAFEEGFKPKDEVKYVAHQHSGLYSGCVTLVKENILDDVQEEVTPEENPIDTLVKLVSTKKSNKKEMNDILDIIGIPVEDEKKRDYPAALRKIGVVWLEENYPELLTEEVDGER